MSLYTYKAVSPDGRTVLGRIDALNIVDLEMRLRRMELDLISGDLVSNRSLFGAAGVPRREIIHFCFHLELLVRAGVPILEGLSDLRDSLEHPRFREVVASMIESIEGGQRLSQAMEGQSKVFNKVFVSLIRAGEATGRLPEVLQNLTESLKWEDELASQTKKLIMYPAFVGTIVLSATFFLMIYMVPQLKQFVKNMGQVLPLQTQVLFFVSDLLVAYWYVALLLPVVLGFALKVLLHINPLARVRFDGVKLKFPLIGEGQNVTAAFHSIGFFPPLVIRMLRVGESTGSLDVALMNVSYFYNRDVKESVEKVQQLIEPMLTVVLGCLLGWIMLAVLGPVYDVISKIKT